MTRLDIFIARMKAQRACIDWVSANVRTRLGPVLELGLGNGRTFDHLRLKFEERQIFVFDREVAAHPDCIPEPRFLRLGDFHETLPAYLAEGNPPTVFIHADIGSANREKSTRLAADLAPSLLQILAPGGYLACDQPISLDGLESLPLPDSPQDGQYHLFQRSF